VLGFILGGILERYMFISIQRYGTDWLLNPLVVVMFALSALSLFRPLLQDVRAHGGVKGLLSDFGRPQLAWSNALPVFLLILITVMMMEAVTWNDLAQVVPVIVGSAAIVFCSLALMTEVFKRSTVKTESLGERAMAQVQQKIHMDVVSTISDLPVKRLLTGGAIFFGWLVVFLLSMATIGLIPTIPIFVIAFMRIEAREPWYLVLPYAIVMTIFVYVVFDWFLALPWPPTLLGEFFPDLRGQIPSV
jgi:hypothetical protein